MPLADRNRSVVANNSRCGEGIHGPWCKPGETMGKGPSSMIRLHGPRCKRVGPWEKGLFHGPTSWSIVQTGPEWGPKDGARGTRDARDEARTRLVGGCNGVPGGVPACFPVLRVSRTAPRLTQIHIITQTFTTT